MKKLIKLLSMIMSYLIIISTSIGATVVNAQENGIRKYLDYSTLDNIGQVVQYKDKALAFSYNSSYNYNYNYNYNYDLHSQASIDLYSLKNNNKEQVCSNISRYSIYNINRVNNLLYFRTSNPDLEADIEFCYNFDNDTTGYNRLEDTIEKTNTLKETSIEKVNEKYSYNYTNNNVDLFSFEEKYDLNGNKYTRFILMPEENNSKYYFNGVFNDNFQYISTNPLAISFDNKNRLIITEYDGELKNLIIVDNQNINKISINKHIISNIYVLDDHFYFLDENYILNSYSFNGDKYTFDKKYDDAILNFSTDNKGNLWTLKDVNGRRIVCKLENNEFKEKYEVAEDMSALSVYDDNNITVYSYNKFTTINATENTACETTNTTDNNNNNNNKNNNKNNLKRLTQTGSPINNKTLLIFASILTTIGGGVFIKRRF